MRETLLQFESDMDWLREVHLPQKSARDFSSAIIYGNEDSPDFIITTGIYIYSQSNLYKRINKGYRLIAQGRQDSLMDKVKGNS